MHPVYTKSVKFPEYKVMTENEIANDFFLYFTEENI